MSIVLPQSEMEKQTNQKKNRGGRVQQEHPRTVGQIQGEIYIYIIGV